MQVINYGEKMVKLQNISLYKQDKNGNENVDPKAYPQDLEPKKIFLKFAIWANCIVFLNGEHMFYRPCFNIEQGKRLLVIFNFNITLIHLEKHMHGT